MQSNAIHRASSEKVMEVDEVKRADANSIHLVSIVSRIVDQTQLSSCRNPCRNSSPTPTLMIQSKSTVP